jgi:hypothetical protein
MRQAFDAVTATKAMKNGLGGVQGGGGNDGGC